MTIIWVQDYNPLSTGGGAQLTDRTHIIEGLKRGYNIQIVTPENQNLIPIEPNDFVIFSNIARFDPATLIKTPSRYAILHHDFLFKCSWRLFFPLSEKCMSDCPQGPKWKPLLEKAVLHVFLSPLHHQMNKEYFGDAVEPHILCPSPVNPDIFVDHQTPGRTGTCNLQGLLPYKGRDNLLGYTKDHPEQSFTFAGAMEGQVELPPNCQYIGMPPDSQLPKFYNQHEWYIDLPNTPQPFNRSVAEAYLCSCKIRGNMLVGALSWPWFNDRKIVAERLRSAPNEFWRTLESIL